MENNKLIVRDDTSISNLIYTMRGKQVILDSGLAKLYQVESKVFN